MLEPNAAYEPRYRVTDTNKGFGNQGEVSASYRGTDPSALIDLIEGDLAELQSCVKEFSKAKGRAAKEQEIVNLDNSIKEKVSIVKEDISNKRARGEDKILIKRLKTRLDKAESEQEKILKEYSKKKRKMENGESESNQYDDLVNVPETTGFTSNGQTNQYDNIPGEDFNEPSVHQEFTQAQDSGLEIRIKEKDAIRDLERDINDLRDINVDLNQHIHAQGEGVDRIELQTESAAQRVSKGNDNTKAAVLSKNENRTIVWILIGIIGGIIAVILIVVIILAAILGVSNN